MENDTLTICRICNKDKQFFPRNGRFTRKECVDCFKQLMRNNYHSKKSEYKNRQLKNRYGISLEDYNIMREEQNLRCKICGLPEADNVSGRSLYVDHDHETGEIRGLLCHDCNLAVEFLKDNPGWADKAIAYLEKHG